MRSTSLVRPGQRGKRWAVTLAATGISTYALDAAATATGLLLVALGALGGFDHGVLIAFLVATYCLWAAGMRVNLAANWALLEQTGTSTNALSKAAYDLASARASSPRTRRIGTATGYVGTELAKEAPYYAGAFGAALTDSVSSRDALIFLAGTNIGAAAYEYSLARLTRAYLRRAPRLASEPRRTPEPG